MMFIRQKFDKILIAVLVLGVFLYASIRSNFRIRSDMPQEFVDGPKASSMHGSVTEREIALAYWNCVVTGIQWKYGYGYHLPQDPPPEFTVSLKSADADTRSRYWRRLQEVWYVPSTWTKEYDWDFNWVKNPVAAAGDWWQEHSRKFSPR